MDDDSLNSMTFGDSATTAAEKFRMESKFVAAKIDHGDSHASAFSGAGQYSFFGNLDDGDSELEGGLEDGIDAPPEEEGLPVEEDLGLTDPDFAATSDLGLATMLGGLEVDSGLGMSEMRLDDMSTTAPLAVANAILDSGPATGAHRSSPASSLSMHGISPIASVETQISAHQSLQAAATNRPLDPVAIMQGTAGGSQPLARPPPPMPVHMPMQQQHQFQPPLPLQPQHLPHAPQPQMAPPGVPMSMQELEAMMLRQHAAPPPVGHVPATPPQAPPAPAAGSLPSPHLLESGAPGGVRAPSPQPGRPPLVPWPGAQGVPPGMGQQPRPRHPPSGNAASAAAGPPPPPPPQRARSQSPVPRQPSPNHLQGDNRQREGSFGNGFGVVNKHHHQQQHGGRGGHHHSQQQSHHLHHRRPRFRAKYMSEDTINHILRIQWTAVHTSRPYQEDYYYQAFLAKHVNGANAAAFAPDALRETAPQERNSDVSTTWVPIEGLGKIAMSNIRRPKPLMDLPTSHQPQKDGDASESGGDRAVHRPLDQEPMLAARIMVEDCMSLLLDVDDIERMFRQGVATAMRVEGADALMQRRAVLMESLASSLRLPDEAVLTGTHGDTALTADKSSSDGVFLRLVTLPKGRRLLAQSLGRLFSPFEPAGGASDRSQLRILWSVMRNLRSLFGFLPPEDGVVVAAKVSKEHSAELARQSRATAMQTTSEIATAGSEAMHRLGTREACVQALLACVKGDLATGVSAHGSATADALLPLSGPAGLQPAEFTGHWLGDILTALLERANVLGLGRQASEHDAQRDAKADSWDAAVAELIKLVMGHVEVVMQVFRASKAQGIAEGMAYARAVVPVTVVRAAILHCSDAHREELRRNLHELSC